MNGSLVKVKEANAETPQYTLRTSISISQVDPEDRRLTMRRCLLLLLDIPAIYTGHQPVLYKANRNVQTRSLGFELQDPWRYGRRVISSEMGSRMSSKSVGL